MLFTVYYRTSKHHIQPQAAKGIHVYRVPTKLTAHTSEACTVPKESNFIKRSLQTILFLNINGMLKLSGLKQDRKDPNFHVC